MAGRPFGARAGVFGRLYGPAPSVGRYTRQDLIRAGVWILGAVGVGVALGMVLYG